MNEFIVYPAHGVGQILAIEERQIAGTKLELFVINFIKDKMTLRVPTRKIANIGMRKLSDPAIVQQVHRTLNQPRHIAEGNWFRRAQEHEFKINSGDIIAIAEVMRDLYRPFANPGQNYSERQLYAAALDRLAREVAIVQQDSGLTNAHQWTPQSHLEACLDHQFSRDLPAGRRCCANFPK